MRSTTKRISRTSNGLLREVDRAELERLLRDLGLVDRRDDDDGHVGVVLADLLERREPVESRHVHVEEDEVGAQAPRRPRPRRWPSAPSATSNPWRSATRREHGAAAEVVVDDERQRSHAGLGRRAHGRPWTAWGEPADRPPRRPRGSPCGGVGRGVAAFQSSTSRLIFIEQNFGPHIEQNCAVLKTSCGSVSSCIRRAVSGSSDSSNWRFQSNA